MIYIVNGERVEAATAAELISKMHALSHTPSDDDRTWMQETAYRANLQNGAIIRTATAEEFIEDLEKAKLIEFALPTEK